MCSPVAFERHFPRHSMVARIRSLLTYALIAVQGFAPAYAIAASFTDVSANHMYKGQIETLADKGIVKGNPDGTFKPGNTVNRAEMLTLLYRAAGKNPAAPSKSCFKDVPTTAWFAAVVCDAAKNGYVGGYADGNFKPEQAVNRVESLKMIHTVLGITLNAQASTAPVKAFTDVSLTAWYAPYMASAFSHNVLPISGQAGSKFYPDSALLRGEAAAYIFNALGLTVASSSSSAQSSSVISRSRASTATSTNSVAILEVDFPLGDDGSFNGKQEKVYRFSIKQPVTGTIALNVAADAKAQCRLYKLEKETSFALEYYVGHIVDNLCMMRVSMAAGDYQLEVVPLTNNASFTLTSAVVVGDGNDGFMDAETLQKNKPKTGYIEYEDFGEFYRFTVSQQQNLTVTVSNDTKVRCSIYPMADVDLFGFSGPVCGEAYDFPPGTYYVGVTRRDQVEGKESFSVMFK